MSDLTLDVGLAARLKVAFARNGWTEQLIDAACEGDKLGQFEQVLLGHASINVVEHVIDCDAQPFVPDGWSVEEHQKGGAFKWDKETQKDALYLSKGEAGSKYIEGNKLRKELMEKSTPPCSTPTSSTTYLPIRTSFPRSGRANTSSSGGRCTTAAMATRASAASAGTAPGGAGPATGSAPAGPATAPLRCVQVDLGALNL